MRKIFARAAIAAALSVGFAGTAQAVPIYFDFTGTADIDGAGGSVISGGFNFETERLFEFSQSQPFPQPGFVDWQPTNLTEPLAFLSFAGREVAWPVHEGTNYAAINFVDACNGDGCYPGWAENFNLQTISEDPWAAGFTGTRHVTSLFVSATNQVQLPDFPFVQYIDYFDSATVGPESIVTLPLYSLIGVFSEYTYTCVEGDCSNSDSRQFSFNIDSVSRGVGPRSVPEPGTLGLLGAALGGFLLRRRRLPAKAGS